MGLLLELSHAVIDENIVEVLTTQVGVAVGSLDLENTIFDREEGYIEGTTTKVENEDVALTLVLLVQSVCDGSCSRLVNDSLHVEACNGTSVLGGLSLRIIEVGWNRDDCILDLFTEVGLGDLLHFAKNHG